MISEAAKPVQVMLVDDSAVVRRALSETLQRGGGIKVVSAAENGRIALEQLKTVVPDVIVLDVEMPEMNGIDTLVAIRRSHPRLPVIMFSAMTTKGAKATIDALAKGATDYIAKPSAENGGGSLQHVAAELAQKIKSQATVQRGRSAFTLAAAPLSAATKPSSNPLPPQLVVLGCSTGGPPALAKFLADVPADFPLPIVAVQHMADPMFTASLCESLSRSARIPVVHVTQNQPLPLKGCKFYLAPGGTHLTISGRASSPTLHLSPAPPVNACRPSVDVLFQSAVRVFGGNLLAVVLTGMGSDCARGAQDIVAAKGQVLVQDEATSVVWGMPGSIAKAGLAAAVVPIHRMALEMNARVPKRGSAIGGRP